MLAKKEGAILVSLARKSIESFFSKEKLDLEKYSKFSEKQGVFVTLQKKGELRGCIGFPYPTLPLYRAVAAAARAAAFDDPRFGPVQEEELKDIRLEISVLTVPEELNVKRPEDYPKKVRIGDDGLIIQNRFTSGLLLPQVFTEYACTPEEALGMTCQKAGLKSDAWRNLSNRVSRFQAQIFREK
jgi:hypothetical protein